MHSPARCVTCNPANSQEFREFDSPPLRHGNKSLAKLEAIELTTTSDCATGGSRVARRDTAMSPDQQLTTDAVLIREAKDGNPKARAEVFRRLSARDRGSELLTFRRWYCR